MDETGLRLIPYIGKTWAKRGRDGTPAFRHHGHWTKVNLIAAISPEGRLFFQTRLKDFDGPAVVDFLKHPLRIIEEYIILVWDNASIHRNKAVKQFLADNADRVEAHFLPAYAFEPMPASGPTNIAITFVSGRFPHA